MTKDLHDRYREGIAEHSATIDDVEEWLSYFYRSLRSTPLVERSFRTYKTDTRRQLVKQICEEAKHDGVEPIELARYRGYDVTEEEIEKYRYHDSPDNLYLGLPYYAGDQLRVEALEEEHNRRSEFVQSYADAVLVDRKRHRAAVRRGEMPDEIEMLERLAQQVDEVASQVDTFMGCLNARLDKIEAKLDAHLEESPMRRRWWR